MARSTLLPAPGSWRHVVLGLRCDLCHGELSGRRSGGFQEPDEKGPPTGEGPAYTELSLAFLFSGQIIYDLTRLA